MGGNYNLPRGFSKLSVFYYHVRSRVIVQDAQSDSLYNKGARFAVVCKTIDLGKTELEVTMANG